MFKVISAVSGSDENSVVYEVGGVRKIMREPNLRGLDEMVRELELKAASEEAFRPKGEKAVSAMAVKLDGVEGTEVKEDSGGKEEAKEDVSKTRRGGRG